MWNSSKLTFKEFEAIKGIRNAIQTLAQLNENASDFFNEKDVEFNLLEDVAIDINHDELFLCIQRFLKGETQVMGIESLQSSGFQVVEVLQHHYDYVFGFIENENERTFYLCETHDNWSEACEEGHYFTFDEGETVIALHDCIRTSIWN